MPWKCFTWIDYLFKTLSPDGPTNIEITWTPDPVNVCKNQTAEVNVTCSISKDDVKEVPTMRMLDDSGTVLTQDLSIDLQNSYQIQKTINISTEVNVTCDARHQLKKEPTINIFKTIDVNGMYIGII